MRWSALALLVAACCAFAAFLTQPDQVGKVLFGVLWSASLVASAVTWWYDRRSGTGPPPDEPSECRPHEAEHSPSR